MICLDVKTNGKLFSFLKTKGGCNLGLDQISLIFISCEKNWKLFSLFFKTKGGCNHFSFFFKN